MNRRSFLKNSIGALLFGALTSNKVLASIVDSTPTDSLDVLLYLIQSKNGDWKIKGTIWTKLAKDRLNPYEYNLDTFKPLKIVDNKDANKFKRFYWQKYSCKGRCVGLNYLQSYKNGIKAKETGQFIDFVRVGGKSLSDRKIKHLKNISQIYGKNNGRRNVETGLLQSICSSGGKAGAKSQMKNGIGIHTSDENQRKEWARLGGLAVIDRLNRERECPYCGIKTKGAAYNRWHGDNCKHKK